MNNETGNKIRKLRLEKGLTQRELAESIGVCAKTVSKWECGGGLPDVGLLPPLCKALQCDASALLDDGLSEGSAAVINLRKARFYRCPVCKSFCLGFGNGAVSCCGRRLAPLEPSKAKEPQVPDISLSDGEWFISSGMPMTKEDYVEFIAFAGQDGFLLFPQYPEWELNARIPAHSHGTLFWYSQRDGLLFKRI
ncbi:MAG: helix-turn-helix transcriptional regulator [Clostridia bacterium]|nr:helix-turn-helix transcriptional regulator [Clostridia bacterium]